jgi:hypothetical protein
MRMTARGPTPTSAKVCCCAAIWDTADITSSRLGHLASRFTQDQARRWLAANLRLQVFEIDPRTALVSQRRFLLSSFITKNLFVGAR